MPISFVSMGTLYWEGFGVVSFFAFAKMFLTGGLTGAFCRWEDPPVLADVILVSCLFLQVCSFPLVSPPLAPYCLFSMEQGSLLC